MSESRSNDIIIVGGGISGCAAAIHARRKDRDVLVITKYSSPERPQRVYIDDKTRTLLKDVLQSEDRSFTTADLVFLEELKETKIASIRKVELYLRNRAERSGVRFIDQRKVKLAKIDLKKQTLTLIPILEEKKLIVEPLGKILVEASGKSRVVFKTCFKDKELEEFLPFQPQHPFYGTALFHLNTNAIANLKKLSFIDRFFKLQRVNQIQFSKAQWLQLKEIGWHNKFPPQIFIIPSADCSKIQVTGHIPSLNQDRQEVIRWFSYMVNLHFNFAENETFFIKPPQLEEKTIQKVMKKYNLNENDAKLRQNHKYKLRVTTFKLQLTRLIRPVMMGPANHTHIVSMGDALKDPYFIDPSGIYDSLLEAEMFGECIHGQEFDIRQYHHFARSLQKLTEAKLKQFPGLVAHSSIHAVQSTPSLRTLEMRSPTAESAMHLFSNLNPAQAIQSFLQAVLPKFYLLESKDVLTRKHDEDMKILACLFNLNTGHESKNNYFFKPLFLPNKIEMIEEMLMEQMHELKLDFTVKDISSIQNSLSEKLRNHHFSLMLICILHTLYANPQLTKIMIPNETRDQLCFFVKAAMKHGMMKTHYQEMIPLQWQVGDADISQVELRTKSS